MQRDNDKSEVYAAESQAFEESIVGLQVGLAALIDLSALLNADDWWNENGVRFGIGVTRREARHSFAVTHLGEQPEVRLALGAEDVSTLMHEVAHFLTSRWYGLGAAPHGPEFRQAECDVATVMVGPQVAQHLADTFASWGLSIGDRRWSDPPTSPYEHGLYEKWQLSAYMDPAI